MMNTGLDKVLLILVILTGLLILPVFAITVYDDNWSYMAHHGTPDTQYGMTDDSWGFIWNGSLNRKPIQFVLNTRHILPDPSDYTGITRYAQQDFFSTAAKTAKVASIYYAFVPDHYESGYWEIGALIGTITYWNETFFDQLAVYGDEWHRLSYNTTLGARTVVFDNITDGVYGSNFILSDAPNEEINLTSIARRVGFVPHFGKVGCVDSQCAEIGSSDRLYSLVFDEAGGGGSSSTPNLIGYTNNAYTNATIGSVLVLATQGSNLTSNFSTPSGYYEINNLIANLQVDISALKAGYTSNDFFFTPNPDTSYFANVSLIPDYIPNSTAIVGIVYRDYDHEPVSGAVVTLENATWSDTYTTMMTGFYMFDGLAAGTDYSVSATATGYTAPAAHTVTTASGVTVQQDIELGSQFDVVVTAKDGGTGAILLGMPVYFEVSDGQTANSTFGTVTFTVGGGVHTFTATATGYTVGQQQASITSDTSVVLLLYNTTTPEAAAIRYVPHTVRLVFVSQLGSPIPGAHVTAVTTESSTPSNWLLDLFGIPSSVGMNTTTLSGTTDSAGSISFAMADVLKYDILVYNSTAGFSKNFTLYPKEDQYTFQINIAPVIANLFDVVKWNLTSYDFSATQISMNLTYNDSAKQTTSLIFYVNGTLNLTPIYTKTVTLTNGNGSAGLVVTNTKGESLTWGFIAQNSAFGQIKDALGLTMKGVAGRLIDAGWTTDVYLWVSYLILFVIAALFSYTNIRFGAVILPFVAGGLWWIGWLSISWVLLGSLIALGVLVYINRSEVKTR